MKPYFVPNIDDLILFTNLHGHWEVDTNRFLNKRRIRRSMANFNDIQPGKISMSHPWSCHYWKKTYLCATCCAHSKWRRKKVIFWWLSWVISTNATCPFNMLTNSLVSAIQLHGTFHIECSRICYISRDSNEHGPFLVQDDSIVLWMSWTIMSFSQSCSRPLLECVVDVLDH